MGRLLFEQIRELGEQVGKLDSVVRKRAKKSDEAKRLMTIPGIGPICAMAVQAFAQPVEASGAGWTSWLGLVPRQFSTGGKPKLGRISKMGQRNLRLLVAGAMGTDEEINKEIFWSSASALGLKAEVGGTGDAGKTEDNARANGRRDGIRKTSRLSRRLRARKSDLDLVRASPCRPAADINAPHRTGGKTPNSPKCVEPNHCVGYYEINMDRMRYHLYRKNELPVVESGCQRPARHHVLLQKHPLARLPRLDGL